MPTGEQGPNDVSKYSERQVGKLGYFASPDEPAKVIGIGYLNNVDDPCSEANGSDLDVVEMRLLLELRD